MKHFLAHQTLLEGGPRGLVTAAHRLLLHIGFEDVRIVDGAHDHGADLLAAKGQEKWVVQCKWSAGRYIDETGINDCDRAVRHYGAEKALLITNAELSPSASRRQTALKNLGLNLFVWDGQALETIWAEKLRPLPVGQRQLRDYQSEASGAVMKSLSEKGKALLILATGLGKTVVAADVIARHISSGHRNVLVLAHLKELVEQLEKSFWAVLPKDVRSHVLHGGSKPKDLSGLTVATPDSMTLFAEYDYMPDLIVIDEAHHASDSGMYADLIARWPAVKILGLTATPWRGDKYNIESAFGQPAFSMGIAQGMARGWLSNVDYRIFADNIDWDFVRETSSHGYSIKDLNKRLFLPERDERIVDHLREAWLASNKPRAIVFCSTIEHANTFASLLRRSEPYWNNAQPLHSNMGAQARNMLLNDFKVGRIPVITCVDVFNEGVDVPDVSIICFLRVTHSRRIFVQQLGRGLRLSADKRSYKYLIL